MQSSWRTEAFSWGVIVAMFAAAAWAWGRVPDRIAIHWNAAGEANGYGFSVLGKVRPNWFVGIRTPWTLSSTCSWDKTHRLGGRLFLACGIATLVCGLVRPTRGVFVMLGTILPSTLVLVAYSYLVWRGDPDRAAG